MVVLKPNVVRGGRAIGLGNNLYLMKGRTHSKGGIDIGKNPKTGLEVENNEVMQVSPQGVRVFSAQPILGGISPAQYILGGANPNQVFNAQEQWKKVNKINDDGTKKARFGDEEKSAKQILKENRDIKSYLVGYRDVSEYTEDFAEQRNLRYDPNTKDVKDFFKSYINSEGFNRIIKNQENWYNKRYPNRSKVFPVNTDKLKENFRRNIENDKTRIFNFNDHPERSQWFDRGDVIFRTTFPGNREEEGISNDFILGHEYGHSKDKGTYTNGQKRALELNTNVEKNKHDERNDEKHSDVWGLKYLLYKQGIYDSRGEKDATGEDISKLRKLYPELRIFKQFDKDDDLANYINIIANNRKINTSNIMKYGGRKIAQDGTEKSRKKMFSTVTKQIKQIAKQEENRNTPLPIRGEKPITSLGYDVASYTPIVGDAIQLGEGISDIKNRNYLTGVINLGLLALPNAIEKPLKNISKIIKNIKLVGEDGKILNSKIIRKPENFYRSVDKSAILDAKKSGFIRGSFPEEEIHGNPYFARTKEPFNWRKYVIEGDTNSADKWISSSNYNNGEIVEVPKKPTIDFSKSYDVGEVSSEEYANYINNYEVFPMTNGSVNASPASKFSYWQKYPVFGWRKKNFKYGGIHIKPSKRGTFTAAAKKHGMSVQGFASKVLANKGKYSSAMIKKANFARNASKWKHKEFGGDMDFNYYITKDNIYKLGGRKKALIGDDMLQSSLIVANNGSNLDAARNKVLSSLPTTKSILTSFRDTLTPVEQKINKEEALRTIMSNQKDGLGTSGLSKGVVGQYLANGVQAGINIGGNIGSYLINRDAIRRMRGPAAPLPLRAEILPTRVSTAAQEAALRENVAKQENLLAGNLSSSRSRLNATNQIRNQGIGLYNQLQERKGEIERELITRDKLNRQGIANQNIAQINQWRNAAREFENKRIDSNSENTIQHLIQGPADAIAGERGFFDNLASNDRYRMTAFLEAIKNPDALKAMNSDEIKQLARRFGVRTSWLRSIGVNI